MEFKYTFNEAADEYQTYRPHYPAALFDKLVADTGLKRGARLLEIGPGTGQATEPLAQRGFQITAVELGDAMAKKAREVLSAYPNVQIITGAFETVTLPDENFDLVYSATAFHWIDPAVKFSKTHDLLKPSGYLAIIHTYHVSDEAGDTFFNQSQPIFLRYVTSQHPMNRSSGFRPVRIADVTPTEAIDESLFEVKSFTTFAMSMAYSAEDFVHLIGTYSPHLALKPDRRAQFLAEIKDLINRNFGGRLTKHYAMSLLLARKRKP